MNTQFKTIDEYINSFPDDIQLILETMRQTIRKAAPRAIEVISYRMPGFKLNGSLVWFATFKNRFFKRPVIFLFVPYGLFSVSRDVPIASRL